MFKSTAQHYVRRFRQRHAIAGKDYRLLGLLQQMRSLGNPVVRADDTPVFRTTRDGNRLGLDLPREHVHRNVDQNGAAPASLRQIQRARHHVRQELRVIDAPHPLADRAEDVALRGIGVESDALMRLARVVVRRRVPGDDDHRRAVGGCGRDAGQCVGQTRRQVHVDDRQPVGHAEISVGRVCGLLFVPERHVLDPQLVARVNQRVIRVAALAEYLFDTFLSQAFGDEHRSGHAQGSPHISNDAGCLQSLHFIAIETELADVNVVIVLADRAAG